MTPALTVRWTPMTRSSLVPIAKRVASSLPGFAARGRMILRAPVGDVLVAIHLEPSAFEKVTLKAVAFAMPLCVPCDYVHFGFSHGLQNGGRTPAVWQREQADLIASLHDAIVKEALPFFEQRQSLMGLVAAYSETRAMNRLRDLAYCSARHGDRERALEFIERLQAIPIDLSSSWQSKLRREVDAFQTLLIASPEDAMRQLDAWEQFTVQSLKLTAFRSPPVRGAASHDR